MLILSSAYLAPVQYYAHLYAAGKAVEDRFEHYVKQTYRNRCYIATPDGPLALTIPVERSGSGSKAMRDIRISEHGNWRHLHWNALTSAYESSPYFEYYADDFRLLYERKFNYLVDFNAELQQLLLNLLDLQPHVTQSEAYIAHPEAADTDLRVLLSPKAPVGSDAHFEAQPYWQVFAERTGFLPNLSMADLLFNMGPESRLVLKRCMR